jgi:hypothetical protein
MILVGQMELARRLEKRANLMQRIGTFRVIEKISSPEMVKTYVDARLGLAGGATRIFTDDAVEMLWEYSEHGVPRLINKMAKLCLKAGETNGLRQIDGLIVREMGERFQNLSGKAVPKRKPRIRSAEPDVTEKEMVSIIPLPTVSDPVPESDSPCGNSPENDSMACGVAPEAAADNQVSIMASFEIRGIKIEVDIGRELLAGAAHPDYEEHLRLAGFMAARILKDHPELTFDPAVDPISVWSDVRNLLLQRMQRQERTEDCTAPGAAV